MQYGLKHNKLGPTPPFDGDFRADYGSLSVGVREEPSLSMWLKNEGGLGGATEAALAFGRVDFGKSAAAISDRAVAIKKLRVNQ